MTAARHPAAVEVEGHTYLRDARGNLVPLTTVKPADLLMDEVVRGLIGRAAVQSESLTAFMS